MDNSGLRFAHASSAHSVLSNTTDGRANPGMLPAAIYPEPSGAGIPPPQQLPAEARDPRVMGSMALASMEVANFSPSMDELLSDPEVSKWFEDNGEIPRCLISIISAAHMKKMNQMWRK